MGYSYIYLFCLLILFMFIIRYFLPFLTWLLPVFLVVFIINLIFGQRKKTTTHEETSYNNQDTYYQQNQRPSNPDIIDVDYKVVDEEDNDTH